jgi:Flp pilus assembly protein TadB
VFNIIIIILIALLAVLGLLIAFFAFLANSYQKLKTRKSLKKLQEASVYHRAPSNKTDLRSRDKVAEKKQLETLSPNVEKYNPAALEPEDVQIVGLAKPVGFWSKFVMNQRMGFLVARMGLQANKDQKGYWVNLIKAQALSQGKNQNKGR